MGPAGVTAVVGPAGVAAVVGPAGVVIGVVSAVAVSVAAVAVSVVAPSLMKSAMEPAAASPGRCRGGSESSRAESGGCDDSDADLAKHDDHLGFKDARSAASCPVVEMPVAIVHPRPLVQIAHGIRAETYGQHLRRLDVCAEQARREMSSCDGRRPHGHPLIGAPWRGNPRSAGRPGGDRHRKGSQGHGWKPRVRRRARRTGEPDQPRVWYDCPP